MTDWIDIERERLLAAADRRNADDGDQDRIADPESWLVALDLLALLLGMASLVLAFVGLLAVL